MHEQQHTQIKNNFLKINKKKKRIMKKDVKKHYYFLPAGFCTTWIHIATEDALF